MFCLQQKISSYHGLNVENCLTNQNLTAIHMRYMYWHNQPFKISNILFWPCVINVNHTVHDCVQVILPGVYSVVRFFSKGLQRYSLKKDCEKRLDLQTGFIIYS